MKSLSRSNRYVAYLARAGALISWISWAATPQTAHAQEIITNSIHMADAPSWVSEGRIDRVIERIQRLLEWDIRRVNVSFYPDEDAFRKMHGFNGLVLAFSKKSDYSVHISPRVTDRNFDAVFGHEMVHIISFQKYHEAIPKWLEEGLANYLAKQGEVNYGWLASQSAPADVRELVHAFSSTEDNTRYHYLASQALTEMIASKCDLGQLLQLSVGKKLESYLSTFCGIDDINADFKKWISIRQTASSGPVGVNPPASGSTSPAAPAKKGIKSRAKKKNPGGLL